MANIEKAEAFKMALTFYPHEDDLKASPILEKLAVLLEAAERYKAIILEIAAKNVDVTAETKKRMVPREVQHAFNWEEIARLLRELRNLPESNHASRMTKADHLTKLAEIYEVLRAAKMPKLEAVRLALVNEAAQLRGTSSSQVA